MNEVCQSATSAGWRISFALTRQVMTVFVALTLLFFLNGCGVIKESPSGEVPVASPGESPRKGNLLSELQIEPALLQSLKPEHISNLVEMTQRTLETAPDGDTRVWSNRESGIVWSIEPTRTVLDAGTLCRDYVNTVRIDGRRLTVPSHACRKINGWWVSGPAP